MKLKEVMCDHVEVVKPNDSLQKAAAKMKTVDAGPMPVVEKHHPVGIVTDRDIVVRAIAEGKSPKTKVKDIMTEDVVSCFEDQEVKEGAKLMAAKQVRRLLILNHDEELVGIVSLCDIARETHDKVLEGTLLEEISLNHKA